MCSLPQAGPPLPQVPSLSARVQVAILHEPPIRFIHSIANKFQKYTAEYQPFMRVHGCS
jgi:hypothetical protein